MSAVTTWWGRRRPTLQIYWPLVALVVVGCVVRAVVMLTYSSMVFLFQTGDSSRYVRVYLTAAGLPGGSTHIFSDRSAPAAYPIFLLVLRKLSTAMPFTIFVQHCLGIATALLLYAAARRLGVGRAAATVPAAVVLLSGDQIFLEHALLTESLWAVLIAGALYALVRSTTGGGGERWLVAAGIALAVAMTVRQQSAPLLIIAALWAAAVAHRGLVRRLRSGLMVLGPAVLAVAFYGAVAHLEHGNTGLDQISGFQLYGRVAQFADCTKFRPPAGTRVLCQRSPADQRQGPSHYLFDESSPLRQHFKQPFPDALLGTFARRAIIHQPGAYAGAVFEEVKRIAGLGRGRLGDGANPSTMRFDNKAPFGSVAATPQAEAAVFGLKYSSIRVHPRAHWAERLSRYQAVFRLHEILVIPLILLALIGAFFARGAVRAGIVLFFACSIALYAVPPITALWDVRYGVVPGELLVVAAAAGGWAIAEAFRYRKKAHTGFEPVPPP